MNSEQGILSAAQMDVDKVSGGAEDEEEEAACDERVGGEARELAEDSPLRGRVLHDEAAMREGEGGGDEGEGEANDEGEGEGEAGTDGSRLTKPKKLSTSSPACNTWLVPQLTRGSRAPPHRATSRAAVTPRVHTWSPATKRSSDLNELNFSVVRINNQRHD